MALSVMLKHYIENDVTKIVKRNITELSHFSISGYNSDR